jgi:hypothetical protein
MERLERYTSCITGKYTAICGDFSRKVDLNGKHEVNYASFIQIG